MAARTRPELLNTKPSSAAWPGARPELLSAKPSIDVRPEDDPKAASAALKEVRFEENELPENLEPLMTQALPTEQRLRAKEKDKADKAAGIVKVVKRRPQVVEQHFDDCGSSMQSIMFLDREPLEVFEFAEIENPEVGMTRSTNI